MNETGTPTVTGATDSIKLTAASFTGAAQSSPLDASNATSGWGGNPTISLTTGTANNLVTATLSRFGTTDATTNRTSLYNSTASSTLGAASYQIATAAGSYSDTYTGSASADWSMVMAGFKPATGGTGSTTMYMIHGDHLGGSNVVTDANGDVVEVADYYPYGTERISSGSFEEQRKFAGTEYDSGTGLNYMGARYYAGGKGRFLSEDPVFLSVGSPELKQKTGLELQKYLENPQMHNSYSYAANNPLKYVDKEGEWIDTVVDIAAIAYSGYKLGHAIVNGGDIKNEAINFGLDGISTALPGVAGLGTLRRAANVAEGMKDGTRSIQAISKQYNWGNPKTLSDHFDRHGAAFGAKTPEEYARKANDFLGNAANKGFDSFVDQKGVTRIYDQKTNTFGSYNPDGTTKTFFKPDPAVHGYATNADYWKSLKSAIK